MSTAEQKVSPSHVPAGCQNECPDTCYRSLPTDAAAGVCVYANTCIRAIERGEKGEGQRGVLVCTCDMIHVGIRTFASCWK